MFAMSKDSSKETIELLNDADKLLRKAILLNGSNVLFVDTVVEMEMLLDDAIALIERNFKKVKKRS